MDQPNWQEDIARGVDDPSPRNFRKKQYILATVGRIKGNVETASIGGGSYVDLVAD